MTWRLNARQKLKYQAAKQLGLIPRLKENGWAGLTAKETGRVGAAMRNTMHKQE